MMGKTPLYFTVAILRFPSGATRRISWDLTENLIGLLEENPTVSPPTQDCSPQEFLTLQLLRNQLPAISHGSIKSSYVFMALMAAALGK